jgi:hypothetical protein
MRITKLCVLTTSATPPAEMLVATASIRNHEALVITPMNQKDLTALEAALESRQQPFMNRRHCKRGGILEVAAPILYNLLIFAVGGCLLGGVRRSARQIFSCGRAPSGAAGFGASTGPAARFCRILLSRGSNSYVGLIPKTCCFFF